MEPTKNTIAEMCYVRYHQGQTYRQIGWELKLTKGQVAGHVYRERLKRGENPLQEARWNRLKSGTRSS